METPAKIASSIAGRPCFGTGNLDEQVGLPRPGVQILGRGQGAARVIRQQWRDLQRHPPVHAFGLLMDGPEQLRRSRQVFDRQLKEQRFPRFALT